LGSARVSRVGFGVAPKQSFSLALSLRQERASHEVRETETASPAREDACATQNANCLPYSSVPSFRGGAGENFSSDFTRFPGNGRTRSKMRAANGLAVA
jgi:hypothetical protein